MSTTLAEHPVFNQFEKWSGSAPILYNLNFVGQRINRTFKGAVIPRQARPMPFHDRQVNFGVAPDETFEWLAILEAILDADETFTMVELGAGFGRWLVTAGCALRRKKPTIKPYLIGVEAEPTHFQFMKQHFAENGINPNDHKLIEAAVNGTGEPVPFSIGHSTGWYGQSITSEGTMIHDYPESRTITVPGVRLDELISPYSRVDLVDMDIQGAELEVVTSSIDAMSRKVKRAVVATHSLEIHSAVGQSFESAGWEPIAVHGWRGDNEETEFGPITFQDGVQYWRNPHF